MTWQLAHPLGSFLMYDNPSAKAKVWAPTPSATPTAAQARKGSATRPRRRRRDAVMAGGILGGAGERTTVGHGLGEDRARSLARRPIADTSPIHPRSGRLNSPRRAAARATSGD